LCTIPPANTTISSAAHKLCARFLKKIISFLYHKRGDENNYALIVRGEDLESYWPQMEVSGGLGDGLGYAAGRQKN
jgi:hypothetical protein